MQIGRKIYYELITGNVILDTGERQGDVVETTEAQDWQLYSALQPYQQSSVGVLQLNYGDYAQNFVQYPLYHINIAQNPPVIAWDGTSLSNAQSAQINALRQGYAQTISQGFNYTFNTATPTTVTFGWSTDDKTNLLAVQESITDGFLTFPILYSDIRGVPVNIPDQVTLTSIKSKASSFFSNQHQQILNLISQVQNATTVSAVQAITWTPAAY